MKFRILTLLLLLTSGLFSQNVQQKGSVRKVTAESFYKMQFSVEDQGYLVKSSEVIELLEAAVQLANLGKLDTLTVLRTHARCKELMFFAFQQKKLAMEEVRNTFQSLDKTLNEYLECEKFQAQYKAIFLKDSTSKATLEEVVNGLGSCHCQGADLYMKTAKRLFDKDTTPERALLLARYFLRKSGYGFALPLLQSAVTSKDPKVASEANTALAGAYRFYSRMEESVGFARKAIELNPANGMAYVIIGDSYYLAAGNCGTTDLEKTKALWAAYDKYQKGAKVDASLKEIVKLRQAVLNHRFPDAAQLAALKLTEGVNVKVGSCWIKETTQVRARKTP